MAIWLATCVRNPTSASLKAFSFRLPRLTRPRTRSRRISGRIQPVFRPSAMTESGFGFFTVVNIRPQGIPADDTSFCVPPRERAYMEPAVYAIGTTDTILGLIWVPDFNRVPPIGHHASKVIGMNNVGSCPIFQF